MFARSKGMKMNTMGKTKPKTINATVELIFVYLLFFCMPIIA